MKSTPLPSTFRWIAALALAVGLSSSLFAAEPVVSNVNGVQRAGTKLVDISYDVTADTPTVTVSLRISSDGGATFSVPVTTLSGAVGADVAVGAGKVITWNAGTDWLGNYSSTMRFEVTAEDGVVPVPADMALIPAGSFTMGDSLDGDSNAPPVTVSVGAFYMGKYEVTKALWDEVRTWGLANGYSDLATGAGKDTNHPVQSISWFDMVKWCNARSEKEGLTPVYTLSSAVMKTGTTGPVPNWSANGYRLPTEAEWEKAARGGVSGKRFPWGTDTISHSQANYYASSSYSYDSSGSVNNHHPTYATGSTPYTSPVGAFTANGYGLHDMSGNVFEWCWDWYGASTYMNGVTDPRGAASGAYRVVRGCGWYDDAGYCRVAARNIVFPAGSDFNLGFRVARSSVPEEFALVEAGSLPADSWAGAQSVAAFYMGKTEVTWAEFQAVRTWAAANGYDIGSVGAGTGPNHPVNSVGWYQALKWCNARSEKEGLNPVYKVGSAVYRTGESLPSVDETANGYRLPIEKEWEFAARGGVKTNGYEYSGSNDVNAVAWYYSNSSDGTKNVAINQANELGLFDMSGNVWEWCFDIYFGSYRVLRGGGWLGLADGCLVVDRNDNGVPHGSNVSVGFRVARSLIGINITQSVVDTRSPRQFQFIEGSYTWQEAKANAVARGRAIGPQPSGA